jgi:hypothetical protein
MADRPHFSSREDYQNWKRTRTGAGTAVLDPPQQVYQEPVPVSGHTERPTPAMITRRPSDNSAKHESGRVYEIGAAAVALAIVAAIGLWWLGAHDSSLDARTRIDAAPRMRGRIAQFINGSELWQSYLDRTAGTTRPVVAFGLEAQRIRLKSRGGDYDPGTVKVVFSVVNLRKNQTIYERDMKVTLDAFMVGRFDKDATRDEIQEIAFRDAEEKVMPYLDRWVDLAAMRAMGQEGRYGAAFVDQLEGISADKWASEEMQVEATTALNRIQGSD